MDKLAERVARKFAEEQQTADWEMTLRDPEGDEPVNVEVGPPGEGPEHMAVAPEGWEGPIKEMKKDPDIENPWALAWYMKGEGYKPHKEAVVVQDIWMTPQDVANFCPPCAKKMASLNIRRIRASALFNQDMLKLATTKLADEWKDLPTGWDDASRKKFWESIGGSVTKCMEEIKGHVDDPGAFCASLKDRIEKTTGWRGPE